MATRNKNRQRRVAGSSVPESIEKELSELESLSLDQIRQMWRDRFANDPPPLRARDILLRMLAWRVQAEALGGFDSRTERNLREIAKGFERDPAYRPKTVRSLSPGVVLTREWKGALQRVTVTQEGFTHLARHYASLSDVARAITGTRWSGPRFFGLERSTNRSTSAERLS